MKKQLFMVPLIAAGLVQEAAAQDRAISGRVVDRGTNEGLPGVTVLVKGTNIGAATNSDGSFSISVPASANTLVFTSVGYVSMEQEIGTSSTLNVSLASDTKQLNEVVVTALGREVEKKALGYSTQTIDNQQLTQGRERSVLSSLQGKVAGVQISQASGGVGSSTRVVIRGNKSLTGNNQPLYVIDGIPIDNNAIGTGDNLNNGVDAGNRGNDVNPDDVESMNILKGPAAVALYGSRAANGVIVITTRSGRSAAKRGKKAEITYTTSYSVEDILRLPKFQNEFGQGTSPYQSDTRENWSWGPRFDGVDRPWGQVVNNQQRIKPYSAQPDNVKDFFQLGRLYTNTLQVGGGSNDANYILSVSNTNQKGITPTTKYNRFSVKAGGEVKLTNKFTSSANITYTRSNGDLAVTGQGASVYDQVVQTPRDINLLELKDLNNQFNTINGFYGAYTENPWQILNSNFYRNDVDRLFGNVQLGYSLNEHIRANWRVGTDVYSDRRRQFTARRDPDPNSQNAGVRNDGEYTEAQYSNTELTSDVFVTYNGNITPDLTVSALVGHNFNQRRFNATGIRVDELIGNTFQSVNNNRGQYSNPIGSGISLRRLMGAYGTLDFGFRDFLFLSLTGRNDWSSTLPESNRSFFYPGVSLGYVFTENFGLKDNKYLSFGKLRAAYGQVGNDASPYLTQAGYFLLTADNGLTNGFANQGFNFPLSGVPALSQSNLIPNPQLQPEITKSYEFGGEFRFWQDRITVDATYYDARSTKQIFTVPISSASGFSSRVVNAGEIRNRGIELLVGVTPIKVAGFQWDISANYTKNKNTVEELFEGTNEIVIGGLAGVSLIAREGAPYGILRASGYQYTPAGNIIVNEANGLPIISTTLQDFGDINPDYLAGITNTFSFKGLRATFVFDTKQGGVLYSRTKDIQGFVGTDPRTLYNDRRPWVVPNSVVDNGDGTFRNNVTAVAPWDYFGQTPDGVNIIDASFVKFREASITYTLPSKWLSKTPFGSLTVGVNGRNLYLWTPKENTYVDPETNNFGNGNVQGFDFTGSPSTRSFGGNLSVTF